MESFVIILVVAAIFGLLLLIVEQMKNDRFR